MTTVDAPEIGGPAAPMVEIVEVAELGHHAAAWDVFASAAPQPSPFLLSWWLGPQADETGAACFVLVVDAQGLLGGLAVRIDRILGIRRVRMLGADSLAPDHLDLVAAPDRRADVVTAIARWFVREPTFADLRGLAEEAVLLDALPSQRLVTVISAAPYLPLPPAAAPPIKPLHRGQEGRRHRRRLERDGVFYRVVEGGDPGDFERALSDLRARHVERWGEGSGLARSYPLFARVARAAATGGSARIHELTTGAEVIATEVTFDVAGRRHRYQSGRSTDHHWRGAGGALTMQVIEGAQAEGFVEVDFLRGREDYKYDWTETERDVLRARASHGLAPRVVLRALVVAERARPAARAIKAKVRGLRARRPARAA